MSQEVIPSVHSGANVPAAADAEIHQIYLEQAKSLCQGGELLPGGVEHLARRLQWAAENQTPLKVKLGLDPTRPDLHLGHTVVLRKMRAFQDLGHQALLLIGDATAMIGDPSGRSQTRPPLTEEEVQANAQTYLDQAGRVVDVRKARIVRNSEWFKDMHLGDFLKLAAKSTVAQIMDREDFAKRYSENKPIYLHELFYPLMQGYDSVALDADIELGGTDQRFNNLMGRELQTVYSQNDPNAKEPQMVLLMPLLEGTDGKVKMSKSYPEHCINITDAPEEMFGKMMSIPDELIGRYQTLLTPLTEAQVKDHEDQMASGALNPRDVKAHLAKWVISQYYGQASADAAEQHFVNLFKNKQLPDDMPEATLAGNVSVAVTSLIVDHQLAPSKGEARRLIQGGGVRLIPAGATEGEKVSDVDAVLTSAPGTEWVLQVGKRKFFRLKFS